MTQGYVSNGSCQSCSVIKYKRKENPCSGYQTCQCGGEIGAGVCYSGSCEKIRPICAIGWIYYGDNTCSLDRRSYGSPPLGVVVYVTDGGLHGQVMRAHPTGTARWSSEPVDIPGLPNYTTAESASRDYNSCGNTDVIVAFGNGAKYLAAHAARNYAPTTETRGKWCLPAAGILTSIHNNKRAINTGMSKLEERRFMSSWWSSSEYDNYEVWKSIFHFSDGLNGSYKNNGSTVRAVLEF